MDRNIRKASFYYLLKSKDTAINFFVVLIISLLVLFVMKKGLLEARGINYVLLIIYVLVLATTLIQANSMIVDLTVKDILSNRVQFFLSCGIDYHKLLTAYSMQIFVLSSIVPLLLFLSVCFYVLTPAPKLIMQLIVVYISTAILGFITILAINIASFSIKKYKLFKNILFFGCFFFIYAIAMFAEDIAAIANRVGVEIWLPITVINIILAIVLLVLFSQKKRALSNEKIVTGGGKWE